VSTAAPTDDWRQHFLLVQQCRLKVKTSLAFGENTCASVNRTQYNRTELQSFSMKHIVYNKLFVTT